MHSLHDYYCKDTLAYFQVLPDGEGICGYGP
jgi:hypothetical protein